MTSQNSNTLAPKTVAEGTFDVLAGCDQHSYGPGLSRYITTNTENDLSICNIYIQRGAEWYHINSCL